jgi:hypothetical protein
VVGLLTWKREENGGYLMSDYVYVWLIVVRGGMVVLYVWLIVVRGGMVVLY